MRVEGAVSIGALFNLASFHHIWDSMLPEYPGQPQRHFAGPSPFHPGLPTAQDFAKQMRSAGLLETSPTPASPS